jgi:peptidoglycan/LPS O-acetylase OafA/YrhL
LEDEKKKNRGPSSTSERRTAAGPSAGREGTREPAGEVSRGKRGSQPGWLGAFARRLAGAGPLAWAVLALGLLAAVLMVMTEFSTIQSVRIGESTCGAAEERLRDVCSTGGSEQHNWSLLVLGIFAALLAFGAAVGRSKPAALALGAVGLIVLAIALLLDRPTLDDKHGLEVFFGQAGTKPQTGGGYTLELIGGAVAVVAAGLALLRERVAPRRESRRERRAGRERDGDDAAAASEA